MANSPMLERLLHAASGLAKLRLPLLKHLSEIKPDRCAAFGLLGLGRHF